MILNFIIWKIQKWMCSSCQRGDRCQRVDSSATLDTSWPLTRSKFAELECCLMLSSCGIYKVHRFVHNVNFIFLWRIKISAMRLVVSILFVFLLYPQWTRLWKIIGFSSCVFTAHVLASGIHLYASFILTIMLHAMENLNFN